MKQCNTLSECKDLGPMAEHLILNRIEETAKLTERDILGVPLSKPLDNHKIPRAERVAFVQKN